jgi:hypothetical protein
MRGLGGPISCEATGGTAPAGRSAPTEPEDGRRPSLGWLWGKESWLIMFDFSALVILKTRGKVNKFINFAVEILANLPIILLRKLLSNHQGAQLPKN